MVLRQEFLHLKVRKDNFMVPAFARQSSSASLLV